MKLLRFLMVFAVVATCAGSLTLKAADKKEDKKTEEKCDCAKDKDGKACGVDKDCCCTGKKAEKSVQKT